MLNKDFLKTKRQETKITQQELATRLEISRGGYAKIETGERTPSVKLAKKIGKELDFDWTMFY